MRLLALAGAALFAISLTNAGGAQAAQNVCSAIWSPPNGVAGGTKSAPIQGSDPACPSTSLLATLTVGTGANAGTVVPSGASWDTDAMSSMFPTTSDSGIAIGSLAATTTPASSSLNLKFDRPVANPYFYTAYFNAGESLTFSTPFTIRQSNGISLSGSTISGTGSPAERESGFVAQFLGSVSQIDFQYTNSNTYETSFGFTTGVTPVPGPLPILAVGAALSQSRRLRRLSNRRGTRSGQPG